LTADREQRAGVLSGRQKLPYFGISGYDEQIGLVMSGRQIGARQKAQIQRNETSTKLLKTHDSTKRLIVDVNEISDLRALFGSASFRQAKSVLSPRAACGPDDRDTVSCRY
jgi:hypothetical protein